MQKINVERKYEDIYEDKEILDLIDYLVNVYILKYPISNHVNRNINLIMKNIERKMTIRQRCFMRCIPFNNGKCIVLSIDFKNQYFYDVPPIFIKIDIQTEKVDDFSIMSLTKYYHSLRNNITIQELFDIMLKQHVDFVDTSQIENYLMSKAKLIESRDFVIDTVLKKLGSSDSIFDNAYYRSKKFLDEFNKYYYLQLDDEQIEERIKMSTSKDIKIRNKII